MPPAANPTVTFVVPCYNLGHLLRECVESILAQTYTDFEVLIMDDCSPDDTPCVAQSFSDPRVRHIRNDPNLGHLRNYDKGITLARGRYLWLISADDKLRRDYVLARFVATLDAHPEAGYVFCPANRFNDDGDVDVYGAHGDREWVSPASRFVRTLLNGNSVSAPAVLARTACYHRIGGFPLDLPFAGDWYVWARFALDRGVVYLPEPMVGYRLHAANMTKGFLGSKAAALVRDELEVRWRIRRDAAALGDAEAVAWADAALVSDYAGRAACHVTDASPYGLTLAGIEESVRAHGAPQSLARRIHSAVWVAAGDAYYDKGQTAAARRCYGRALGGLLAPKAVAKYLLATAGTPGRTVRWALTLARSGQAE